MGELSSDGDAGPPVDGIKREFFMEEGIPIYGLQHCVHNLTKSIHESLTYWSKFYNILKNVGGASHDEGTTRAIQCDVLTRHTLPTQGAPIQEVL